ncbi:MAG TPA: hypothetical protein V6D00_08400 [Pantanalinema sp.]
MAANSCNPNTLAPTEVPEIYRTIAVQNCIGLGRPPNADVVQYAIEQGRKAVAALGSSRPPALDPSASDDELIEWLKAWFGLVLGELLRMRWVQVFLVRSEEVKDLVDRHPSAEIFSVIAMRGNYGRAPYLHVVGVRKATQTRKLASTYMDMRYIRLHRLIMALARQYLKNKRGTPSKYWREVHHLSLQIFNNLFSALLVLSRGDHLLVHKDIDPAGAGVRIESGLIDDWVIDRINQGEGLLRLVVIHTLRAEDDPAIADRRHEAFPSGQAGAGGPGHGPDTMGLGALTDDQAHGVDLGGFQHGVGHGHVLEGGVTHPDEISILDTPNVEPLNPVASGSSAAHPRLGVQSFRASGRYRKRAHAMRDVFNLLIKLGGQSTIATIGSIISQQPQWVRRVLADLIADGFVSRPRRGIYTVANSFPVVHNKRSAGLGGQLASPRGSHC